MMASKWCQLQCVLRQSRLVTRQYHHVVQPLTCIYANRVLGCDVKLLAIKPELSWSILSRNYAKKKGKTAQKQTHVVLNDIEISPVMDIAKYRSDLQTVLDDLKQDYIHKLSLRTTTASFDRLQIKTNDGTFPLNQIASLLQKTPALLIINLAQSVQYVPDVLSTLRNSGMNLNPQQEGPHTIFINIPKVSREHREGLVKSSKTMFNTSKERFTRVYNNQKKQVDKLKKLHSEDLLRGIGTLLLEEMRGKIDEAEKLMKAKQNELLGSEK